MSKNVKWGLFAAIMRALIVPEEELFNTWGTVLFVKHVIAAIRTDICSKVVHRQQHFFCTGKGQKLESISFTEKVNFHL